MPWLWCHAIVTEFLLWRLKLSDLAVPMLVFWNKTWNASDGLTVKVVVVHCMLIGWSFVIDRSLANDNMMDYHPF